MSFRGSWSEHLRAHLGTHLANKKDYNTLSRLMASMDTERLESFHLLPVSTQQVGSNTDKRGTGNRDKRQSQWRKMPQVHICPPKQAWKEPHQKRRRGTAGYRRAARSHRNPTLAPIVMKILGQDQRQIICMENWACSDLHLFRGFCVDF